MGVIKRNVYGGAHVDEDGGNWSAYYRLHRGMPSMEVEEHCPDPSGSVLSSLKIASATSQAAFDAAAVMAWADYGQLDTTEKQRIREVYRRLRA